MRGAGKSLSLLASLAIIGGLPCRLLIHYFVLINSFKVKDNSPCARALKIHFILNFCLQLKCYLLVQLNLVNITDIQNCVFSVNFSGVVENTSKKRTQENLTISRV